jgi:hypothetical protein
MVDVALFAGKIDLDRIIPSCIECARVIESLGGYSGADKLALLQKVLRFAVKESDRSPEEKATLTAMIDDQVPVIVHAAILASKNPIIGQVAATCVGCWTKK